MADKKSYMVPGAHLGADPEFFSAWTLYNIGPECKDNLAALMSVIANRGQPLLAGVEYIENQDVSDGCFGQNITGVHKVWCLKWIAGGIGQMTEQTLADESEGLKMTVGLGESIALPGTIITSGPDTNTFFIRHDSF